MPFWPNKSQENLEKKFVPEHINLDDRVHRIIFDKNLPYEPCKLFTNFPINMSEITAVKTRSPTVQPIDPLHGFTLENVHDSLFWSIISILALYNCKLPKSTYELRKLAVSELKNGILAIKLKDQSFNNDH